MGDLLIVRLRIPNEFIAGNDIVEGAISEENTLSQILH